MVRFKTGVSLTGVCPQVVLGIMISADVYAKHNIDMWVTSVADGSHGKYSRHYQGMAWDMRVWNIPSDAIRHQIFDELKQALGESFMLLDEKDHFHASFKPNFVG